MSSGLEAWTEVRKGYVRVWLAGKFDLQEAKELGRKVLSYTHETHIQKILVDARGVTGALSIVVQIELVNAIARLELQHLSEGGAMVKVAHVLAEGTPESRRFAETLAWNRGMSICVTTSVEEALGWLGVKEEEDPGAQSAPL